jgi:MFS transporter, NNP family, nitrate/nitrite transporter
MIGGLGGFVLPIAFGALLDLTGICDQLLCAPVRARRRCARLDAPAIRRWKRRRASALDKLPELPEMQEIHEPA